MKEKIVKIEVTKKINCYKEIKASSDQNKLLPENQKITPECPFGYTEITENCQHCRWFAENNLSTKELSEDK